MNTGHLLVGFSLASATTDSCWPQESIPLPGGLAQNPDLDSWLRVNADETITVLTGKIELGQGIATALAQIAADELDTPPARITVVLADTARTPDERYTAGSASIESSGGAVRRAAAEARLFLCELAAARLSVPIARLVVRDGRVSDSDDETKSVSYGQLVGGARIERRVTGNAPLKRPADYRFVGKPIPRSDLLEIVTGGPVYVQDLRPAGLLHARVLRPPRPDARLLDLPGEVVVKALPGVVRIVRDGSFVAVVAEREEQAINACDRLRETACWSETQQALPGGDLADYLRALPTRDQTVRDTGNVEAALANAVHRLEATYTRPYHLHGSIGPSCALAQMAPDSSAAALTVWTHSQGVFPLRRSLAALLEMPAEKIRVIGVPGSGCYGHNGADDAAADAALIARAVPGRPVRVQWMRDDEHAWEPCGSAMVMSVRAGLDAHNNVVAWDYTVWTDTHSTRPGGDASALLAARHLATPKLPRTDRGFSGGGHRNAEPLYAFPHQRVTGRAFAGPLRVSALRSLGAYANVFALESFMDELAGKAGVDPVAFRLRHLGDERARAVIEAAAKEIRGTEEVLEAGRGRGMGFARYKNTAAFCAVCAEVVADTNGRITVTRLVAAIDAGQTINPDGLRNQIEGGMIQSMSWTLFERVRFEGGRGVTSRDWETYPILRFADAPRAVDVIVLDRPGLPPLGAGEAAQGPTAAALANAIFRASGTRLRDLPLTPPSSVLSLV